MKASCAELEAYLDETLEGARRESFEDHLLGCASCQAGLEDAMQMLAAGAELSRSPNRPRAAPIEGRSRARRRFGWWGWGAVATAVAAAAVVVLWLARRSEQGPDVDERVTASLAPRRSHAMRLAYAPLDRHRRYDVERGTAAPELIPIGLTAEVEQTRPTAAFVAVLLAGRDFDRAEAVLARAGRDDDLELGRAALAIARKQASRALEHLDGVLARFPANAVALWNRALVLGERQLPLAAAEAFDAVARLAEPGWSAEAAERGAVLRDPAKARAERWRAGKAACVAIPTGPLPERAVVRDNATTCRPDFYEAVRVARTRDALLALMPIAEELDASARNTAAADLVRRVASIDPVRRQRAVEVYLRLIGTPDLAMGEKLLLLEQLRAADQDDLVLGALTRPRLRPELRDEYIRRARAAADPFFAELAEERDADSLLARGDLLGAEVVLRRAVSDCFARDIELRCSYLQFALVNLYDVMHRPDDARRVARAGIDRSRRLGLYWDERLFLDYIARAERLGRAHSIMRAYAREATLRSADECPQVQYNQELLAMASIDDLRFAQARRDLDAGPPCDDATPPTAERARVIAELARIDGSPDETRALQAGLVRTRRQPDQTAGQLANLDAIEGRLLAARDPGAARPVLRRAIEAANRAGRGDADAAIARRDAYGALLVLAAGGGDPAASLALLVEAAGTAPREGACVVGVMVDAERMLVVVRDAGGALAQHFEPRGRTGPELDAAALIPPPMIRSLAGCRRVDVLALPPVFGLANLLPPELAWSYRGRPGAAAAAPPATRPTVVTVAGVTPPAELALAPLAARRLVPIPGATHVDLTGAEATPARVASALALADAVEIHAHGFVDQGTSDASVIALSPQADRQFALRAREIADLGLARSPLVSLAACHAAYTAPYRHEPWGLPRAFLLAGARAVIASPDPIPDAEAGELFRALTARILGGTDPAVALRDERVRRLAAAPSSWIRSVLLFD